MLTKLRVLTLDLCTEITSREVPLLRGAVIDCVGKEDNILYHNHTGTATYKYSYPLIQYKRISGRAHIVAIADGAYAIGDFISKAPGIIHLGNREVDLTSFNIKQTFTYITLTEESIDYHIRCWLPLNEENYQKFKVSNSLMEKVDILQHILKGNILSMCKSLGIFFTEELNVSLTEIDDPYIVRHKGTPLTAFNADFTANINLPDNIGLGKNTSIGFGIITRK